MILELGNKARLRPVEERYANSPAVTYVHIPDADAGGLGGYTLEPGLDVEDFRNHRLDAMDYRNGVTHLPDHEILLACAAAWPTQSAERPSWIHVTPGADGTSGTPEQAAELERFLRDFYQVSDTRPGDVDDTHWSRFGPPGDSGPFIPDLNALFTDDGRTQQAVNYGGGQTGLIGAGSAANGNTLTTNLTLTTNAWAGYRVYVYSTTSNNIVWANVISNTNAASASVLTVDRWYVAATPGGSAGTTPTTPWAFVLADGGGTSAWFVGLSATNSPAHGDHSLSGEIVTGGGGLIRKIAPYALTSGVSPMSFTLIPVFTANGSDSLPVTIAAMACFDSMVVANTTLAMKFETGLSASATLSASGDQLTITETVSGS